MSQSVYEYNYGQRFEFVYLGNITGEDYEISVIYDIDKRKIITIIPAVLERCKIIKTINNKTLSELLIDCLESNLGYIYISKSDIYRYLPFYIKCSNVLKEFVLPLIKETWNIQDLQDYIYFLKSDQADDDTITFLENALIQC